MNYDEQIDLLLQIQKNNTLIITSLDNQIETLTKIVSKLIDRMEHLEKNNLLLVTKSN